MVKSQPAEMVEGSLPLANESSRLVGLPADNIDHLLGDVRSKDYELVDPGQRTGP